MHPRRSSTDPGEILRRCCLEGLWNVVDFGAGDCEIAQRCGELVACNQTSVLGGICGKWRFILLFYNLIVWNCSAACTFNVGTKRGECEMLHRLHEYVRYHWYALEHYVIVTRHCCYKWVSVANMHIWSYTGCIIILNSFLVNTRLYSSYNRILFLSWLGYLWYW